MTWQYNDLDAFIACVLKFTLVETLKLSNLAINLDKYMDSGVHHFHFILKSQSHLQRILDGFERASIDGILL